jgi:hypothetical protein
MLALIFVCSIDQFAFAQNSNNSNAKPRGERREERAEERGEERREGKKHRRHRRGHRRHAAATTGNANQ